MLDFFYWASGIIISVILSYAAWKVMNQLKNIQIKQRADAMSDITGASIELENGEQLYVKNMEIDQSANSMQNVSGLAIKVTGNQSARLQGITITQPNAQVVISDDPSVKMIINHRE